MTLKLSNRQRAYLDAMEVGVWSLRETESVVDFDAEEAPGLKLGPGGGRILLVCAVDIDSASRLANDISRALGNVPVWAWPLADASAVKISHAVEENLFTTVAFFGSDLAGQFCGSGLPANLNSAKLVVLPAMQDLNNQAEARQLLWATFCRSGMVNSCDSRN